MPELEQWVLHRLAELDAEVRAGYAAYDFQGVFQKLFTFCTTDLSAVYFDIRKDALYCDAASSTRRRACRTVLDLLYPPPDDLAGPDPDLHDGRGLAVPQSGRGHARSTCWTFPRRQPDWLNPALAAKWEGIRAARRVVTGALEVQRTAKVIGASLEAAPVVHVADTAILAALKSVDFADLCITSASQLTADPEPQEAFRLPEVPGIAVVFEQARGEKCQRCWKILPDVGTHKHPDTCTRCNDALG